MKKTFLFGDDPDGRSMLGMTNAAAERWFVGALLLMVAIMTWGILTS